MADPIDYETPRDRIFKNRWPQRWRPVAVTLGIASMPSCLWAAAATDGWTWAVLALLTAPIAIVLGVFDLLTIHPRRRLVDRGYRWPIILGSIGLASLAMFVVLAPSMGKARPSAQRVKCASNLRQLAVEAILYAEDHGQLPPDLQTIFDRRVLNGYVFTCPHDHGDNLDPSVGEPLLFGVNTNYVYLGRGLTNKESAGLLLATEPISNHSGKGANVLMNDGTVEFLELKKLKAVLDDAVDQGRLMPELRDILLADD